jgi:hypothetical protein
MAEQRAANPLRFKWFGLRVPGVLIAPGWSAAPAKTARERADTSESSGRRSGHSMARAPSKESMTLRHSMWTLILVSAARAALAQDDFTTPSALPADAIPSVIATAPPTERLTLSSRYRWAAKSSIGPARLAGSTITSALSTASNEPEEYGPHWDGFAKRVGLRLAGGATGTMMEASLGALWDEDPRYERAFGRPLKARLAHVVKMTFLARDREGGLMPAYARYLSVPANSYLSNAWRPDSERDARHTAVRIPMSFLNRAVGNLVNEFWPDATKWLRRN